MFALSAILKGQVGGLKGTEQNVCDKRQRQQVFFYVQVSLRQPIMRKVKQNRKHVSCVLVCVCVCRSRSVKHIGSCLPNSIRIASRGAGSCAQLRPPPSRCLMAPPCHQQNSRTVARQTLQTTLFCFFWLHNLVRGPSVQIKNSGTN